MSWISQFISWIAPTPKKAGSGGRVKVTGTENRKNSLKSSLAAEQAELSREIERLFLAYDERVQDLAMRVRDLPPDASEEEARRLRDIQTDLQLVVRRLDAAIKSRQDLERELSNWRSRGNGEEGKRRAEIIKSELAIRGGDLPESEESYDSIVIEDLVKDRPKTNILAGAEDEIVEVPVQEIEEEEEVPEPLRVPDVEHLLAAIREATREAERWHAIPVEDHDEDALLQVKHVKELNGILKQLDRDQGIERDRMEFAICPREYR